MLGLHIAFALALTKLFTQGLTPIDLGNTPADMISAQACADCHEEHTREWRASRHAAAWTNGIFQAEYRRQPRQWCRNCHAPLAVQQAELAAGNSTDNSDGAPHSLAAEGISCAVCHVRDGRILAASQRPGSPHDTQVVTGFGSADFCAGCHQFNFPIFGNHGQVSYTSEPMQDTVAQYKASRFSGQPDECRGCHAATPGKHLYPGAHDPAMLERALSFRACRQDAARVRITVANVGAGHNVPTGDVHRHMYARAWYSTVPERLYEAYFGRRYEPLPEGGKRTIWDSTLAPGQERVLTVHLDKIGTADTRTEPLNLELRYVYTGNELKPAGGEPASRVVYRMRMPVAELPDCIRPPGSPARATLPP